MKIVVATKNPGKLKEIKLILEHPGLEIVSYSEAGIEWSPPEESGLTFEENALIKALDLSKKTNLSVIADDSGLVIDALGGKPGIMSSRFGGGGLCDEEKNELVLKLMKGNRQRTARFICVAVLVSPDERTWTGKGTVEGSIAEEPSGTLGFGYDPIFVPEGFDVTMAELPSEMKNNISHRAKAFQALSNKII